MKRRSSEQLALTAGICVLARVTLRAPKLFNLRMDPFEPMDRESGQYAKWWTERMFLFAPSDGSRG